MKFNDFQANYKFKGFDIEQFYQVSNSRNGLKGKHVSDDNNNAVIKISGKHIIETKYGYAVIMSNTEVVFIKHWQVWGVNYKSNAYIINFNRDFFNIKTWGNHDDFSSERTFNSFEDVIALAKEQEAHYNDKSNDDEFYF